jgi:predicted RNase H-like HicB family nuclease
LLQKLKIYGVTDNAISWLHCFLTHREQYVQICDVDCDGTEITINSERLISEMGVPQGTILGPSSFITYSNDLSLRIIIAILILFADDSTIIAKGKTLSEANTNATKANTEMVKFADENHLKINASKTKIMQIHTHQTRHIAHPELVINDTDVEAVDECKLLGVIISDTMNWLPQCEKVTNKLRSVTYMFTILKDAVSESSLKLIYYAYAQSQILYSIVIWGGSPHLQKVFVAQKRVIRAMAGLRYWRSNCELDSCRPLFTKYGILTVYSLYILECMKFFIKNPGKFRRKCDVPNSKSPKTRNAKAEHCINDLYVEIKDHKHISNQNPIVMIARIFNALPVPIKMMEDKKAFVNKIKEIVWHNQFYDMNEFFVCKIIFEEAISDDI